MTSGSSRRPAGLAQGKHGRWRSQRSPGPLWAPPPGQGQRATPTPTPRAQAGQGTLPGVAGGREHSLRWSHLPKLHARVWMDGPKHVLLVTSQDRPLCWVPVPQVTEHSVHSAHGDQPSSLSTTARGDTRGSQGPRHESAQGWGGVDRHTPRCGTHPPRTAGAGHRWRSMPCRGHGPQGTNAKTDPTSAPTGSSGLPPQEGGSLGETSSAPVGEGGGEGVDGPVRSM